MSTSPKLEDRSWRELAIKLASNIYKMHNNEIEPKHVEKYLHAIQRKQLIDEGRFLEYQPSVDESSEIL